MAGGHYGFTQSNAKTRRGSEVGKASCHPLFFLDSVISEKLPKVCWKLNLAFVTHPTSLLCPTDISNVAWKMDGL